VKRIIPLLLVLDVLVSCAGGEAGQGDQGIRGRAVAGPQCPVEIEGSPCPDRPWRGLVVAIRSDTGEAFSVVTDAQGRFELPLLPGTYEVGIGAEGTPLFAKPQTVEVRPDAFTDVRIAVDTGIR
jgi:hypothetical protein